MMRYPTPDRHAPRRRAGFTLTELLVVIAIIAVLVGLTAAAVMRWIGGGSQKQTITLMTKLETHLEQHWSEARKKAQNTPIPAALQPTLLTMAGWNGAAPVPAEVQRRADVIWVKLQMRREFPQTFAEALNPGAITTTPTPTPVVPLGPIDEYRQKIASATNTNPNTEAAALLLMALERDRIGMKFNAEEALGAGFIKDTDGDGLPEIVDAWGRPVAFFRWGTNNVALDFSHTAARGAHDRDTEDPQHALMDRNWNPAHQGVATFQQLLHPITQNGQPRSFFTVPTVVSAGNDGRFGLDAYMGEVAPDAKDNVYSFKVR